MPLRSPGLPASRTFECCISETDHPTVHNPRPSAPFRQLRVEPSGLWAASEYYGPVAQAQMFDHLPKNVLVSRLDDWARENPTLYVVRLSCGEAVGAVAFRLPVLPGYSPKLFRAAAPRRV